MIWVGSFKSLQSALHKTSLRCRAGGAHLAAERHLPDLTVRGLAHESNRSIRLHSRKGGVR